MSDAVNIAANFYGLTVVGLERLPAEFHEFRWRVEYLDEITPVTVGDALIEDRQWFFETGSGPLLADPEQVISFLRGQRRLVKLAIAGIEMIEDALESSEGDAAVTELRLYGSDVVAGLRKLVEATSAFDELSFLDIFMIAADQARRYAETYERDLRWGGSAERRAEIEAKVAHWRLRAAYYDEGRRIAEVLDEAGEM